MTEFASGGQPVRRAAARAVELTKTYGSGDAEVVALDHVSVELYESEFTAVMGPSGSGKSTLMHCCAALDSVTSGSVFVGETELSGLGDKELTRLRRDEIGFVFQAFNLVPTLTAGKAFVGEVELGALSDRQLTLLRRDRIGFVFQAFNLVPTLTALENITLPMALAGRRPAPARPR